MNIQANKDATKIALAVTLSICCALWFEWEKPYWAGMSALVMGMNESFGDAINKGRNRILGTIIGAGSGVLLVSLFSQQRFIFLTLLTLILGICVFMASNKKYGYIASTSFIVCLVIAAVGGFSNETTFTMLLLRLQETFLGVLVYSAVYRFLWPKESEEAFFALYTKSRKTLIATYERLLFTPQNQLMSISYHHDLLDSDLQRVYGLLCMPLKGSYRLKHKHKHYKEKVKAMFVVQYCFTLIETDLRNHKPVIKHHQTLLKSAIAYLKQDDDSIACPKRILMAYRHLPSEAQSTLYAPKNYRLDSIKALEAVTIFTSALLLWIYLPIPDSYLFPLNVGVFSCILVTLPDKAVKDWMIGYLVFGVIYIAQYVLIMPKMTEAWQLAIFYFVNIFMLWKIFAKPKLFAFRVLGGNVMMMMTMSALHQTPTYDVASSLSMLVYMMLGLMLTQFYIHIFSHLSRSK